MTVLEFMGGHYLTGTSVINKVINLFTLNIPRLFIKIFRYIYGKITKTKLDEYKDPWFVKGNFKIFKFNIFPFEYFKRQFLIYQINKKFKSLKTED